MIEQSWKNQQLYVLTWLIISGPVALYIQYMYVYVCVSVCAQQESIERREELLRELERAEQMTRRESKAAEAKKKSRALELQSQVNVWSLLAIQQVVKHINTVAFNQDT